MERAFRNDVKNADGEVKFPAGVFFDWPKQTFQQIARNLGKSLDEITVTKEDVSGIFVKMTAQPIVGSRKKTPKVASAKRNVQRTHLPSSMQV